jgi:hypothetical protein
MFYQKEKLITLEDSTKLDRFKVSRMFRSFIKKAWLSSTVTVMTMRCPYFFKDLVYNFQHFFKLLVTFFSLVL